MQELKGLESRENSSKNDVSLESCCMQELISLESRKESSKTELSLESSCPQERESPESRENSSKTGLRLESSLNSINTGVESANSERKDRASGELPCNKEAWQLPSKISLESCEKVMDDNPRSRESQTWLSAEDVVFCWLVSMNRGHSFVNSEWRERSRESTQHRAQMC